MVIVVGHRAGSRPPARGHSVPSVGSVVRLDRPHPSRHHRRSPRVAAITESATLAVDAKAKALKAAGEPVIGFGAGEPDFPTPEPHRRGGRRRLPRPEEPPLHAGRRPARAAGGHRRQDRARLGLRRAAPARCSSPTAASTPSTTPSRRCSTRATRCSCRRPYWTTYPEPIALAGGVAGRCCPPTSRTGFRVTVDQLEAARTDRTKALLFVSPSNPTGAVYPRGRGRGHRPVGGRARHLGRHRRDLRAPRPTATTSSPRCRSWCPSWPTAASCSTAWPRPTP